MCKKYFFLTQAHKIIFFVLVILSTQFSKNRPLGQFFLVVAMSAYLFICLSVASKRNFFKASHWPSDHMISLRLIIGQPSPPTPLKKNNNKKNTKKSPWRQRRRQTKKDRCYPHWSRDSLSPVCGIFKKSRIWETNHLSTDADSSIDAMQQF